jgi:hypothetical protein
LNKHLNHPKTNDLRLVIHDLYLVVSIKSINVTKSYVFNPLLQKLNFDTFSENVRKILILFDSYSEFHLIFDQTLLN